MGMSGALMAMSTAQAGMSIIGGYQQKKEAEYNASVLRRQAGMIGEKQKLEAMRDDRAIRQAAGTTVARTAASGIEFSGSPMTIMIDTIQQMELDKEINQYNLQMQKGYVYGQAAQEKARGRRAVMAGYSGAFSALLSGGKQYLKRKPVFQQTKQPTSRRTYATVV